jgi:uncharacterized membrane protein
VLRAAGGRGGPFIIITTGNQTMSKPNQQVFTGTSTTGSLQEALDDAIGQAGHGVPWRLASIEGVQGFVSSITVRIYAVTQPAASRDLGTTGDEPVYEVPTSRTGLVEDIREQVGICQDGAQFELVTQTRGGEERLRLKATNPDAERVLTEAAGTRQAVTVSGYIRTVECERMDVYDAAPADGQPGGEPGEATTTLQGTVEVLTEEISFCQDGAEYELVTQGAEGEQRLRLVAKGRPESVLRRYAGTGEEVRVTGVIRTVECTSMCVEQAEPVRAAHHAADAADAPAPGEPATTLQGTVEVLAEEISFCQDGAEYELVTQTPEGEQRLRLSAKGRPESVLRRFAGTGEEVRVTGVIVRVECTSMRVEQAEPVRAAAGVLES